MSCRFPFSPGGERRPLVYHRGVKAISTLVAHNPGEYAKVRLGGGERILISASQQGVRISIGSRCDDIRPLKEGYGSAGKGANDDHDLAQRRGQTVVVFCRAFSKSASPSATLACFSKRFEGCT
jgi:hypothetical protein